MVFFGGFLALRPLGGVAGGARGREEKSAKGEPQPHRLHQALASGAATYLLNDTLSDDLIRTVREVHAGGQPIGEAVRARLTERATTPPLTPREVEVLTLVAQGHRNKEIAALLGLSEETVPVHLKNIFAKLRVNERTAAVNVALRRGIVHID